MVAVCRAFAKHNCDGLFVPTIDNLGMRLPVEQIVATIDRHRETRFTVIDGAQALAHVPPRVADNTCDLFLAGVHKWLRAYHPMRIAYYGHLRSAAMINTSLRRYLASRRIDDPLLRLSKQLEHNQTGYGETVGLSPLLTAQVAICDALAHGNRPEATIGERLANADRLASLARKSGWRPVRPAQSMRTGICLIRAPGNKSTRVSAETMCAHLRNAGLAVTTYPQDLVRFSMPPTAWTESESAHLSRALAFCFPAKAMAAPCAIPCHVRPIPPDGRPISCSAQHFGHRPHTGQKPCMRTRCR